MRGIEAANGCAATVEYDLVLLDLLLPDGRGMDLLRRLRARGIRTPIIILTALDRIADRIAGLDAGADDYLVKPFDLAELSARVNAVARRAAGNPSPLVRFGELSIDRSARTVRRDGRDVDLTLREWALLDALLQRPGTILSKAQLEDSCYAMGDEIESNAIEVHVSRLRKKIGRDAIVTVRGLGYRIDRVDA